MQRGQEQNQRPGGFIDDARGGFAAFWFAVKVLSRAWGVFVRRNTGHEYIGFAGMWVPVAALIWAAQFQSRVGRPEAMLPYIAAYLIACAMQRISHLQRRLNGPYVHSRYVGDSMFARYFPGVDPEHVRNHYEPLLLALISMIVLAATNSPVLGLFLISAATASSIETHLLAERDRRVVDQMRDRMWEQRVFFEQMNGASARERVVEARQHPSVVRTAGRTAKRFGLIQWMLRPFGFGRKKRAGAPSADRTAEAKNPLVAQMTNVSSDGRVQRAAEPAAKKKKEM